MMLVLHGACAIAVLMVAASLVSIGLIVSLLGLIARKLAIITIGCSLVALSVVAQSGWDAHCVAVTSGTFLWRWGAFAPDFSLTWMHTASVLVALFVAGELLRRGAVRLLGDTNKALFAGDVPSHVV